MIGRELLADFIGCDEKSLQDKENLERLLLKSVKDAKATVIDKNFYKFTTGGKGVTGYILLAESHVAIHTYPEKKYAVLDIFACGKLDADYILKSIMEQLPHKSVKIKRISRG